MTPKSVEEFYQSVMHSNRRNSLQLLFYIFFWMKITPLMVEVQQIRRNILNSIGDREWMHGHSYASSTTVKDHSTHAIEDHLLNRNLKIVVHFSSECNNILTWFAPRPTWSFQSFMSICILYMNKQFYF